jgi:tetratricopeptide (TPR) repeat protein
LHEFAAAILESVAGEDSDAAACEVADHLSHAIRWLGGHAAVSPVLAKREAAACVRGGTWMLARYRTDGAIALFSRVAANPHADDNTSIRAHRLHASALESLGRLNDAEAAARCAVERGAKDPTLLGERADALRLAASCVLRTRNMETGERELREATEWALAANAHHTLVACVGAIAAVDEMCGRAKESEAGYRRAMELAEDHPSVVSRAQANANLAGFLCVHGRMDEGLERFRDALAMAEAANDRLSAGRIWQMRAAVNFEAGNIDEAIGEFRKAIAIAGETGSQRLACIATGNLGSLRWEIGRHDEAADAVARARELAQNLGDARMEAVWRGMLGTCALDMRRFPEAEAALAQARRVLSAIGDRSAVARVVGAEARLHQLQGRMAESEAAHVEAISALREVGPPTLLGLHLLDFAILLRDAGKFADAEAVIRESIAVLRENRSARREANSLRTLADLLRVAKPDDATAIAEADAIEARAAEIAPT